MARIEFPDGSVWVSQNDPEVEHLPIFSDNPIDWENWGKPTYARIFLGLRAGRNTEYHVKGIKLPIRSVYSVVFDVRTHQENVGRKYGATFVRQVGHYIPTDESSIGDEREYREDSVQIVLYPADTESWSRFKANVRELTDILVDTFSQESVIVEFIKDGYVVGGGKFYYVDEIKDRKSLDVYDRIGDDEGGV